MSALKTVKNASPQYMNFVWVQYGKVREAQIQGRFAYAAKLATTLIPYLPDDLKKKFHEQADLIIHTQKLITSGTVCNINTINDTFHKQIQKNKILETYSDQALNKFINDLSSAFDKKGYFEIHKNVPTGYGPGYKK